MPNTDEYIGVVISDVARLLRTEFDRRVRRLGITRAQWLVLTRLHRRPGASHSELAEMMEVEKATAGRMIDRLEANGWVERRAQPGDRRVKRVYLTAEAERVHKRIWRVAEATVEAALADLSARESKQLFALAAARQGDAGLRRRWSGKGRRPCAAGRQAGFARTRAATTGGSRRDAAPAKTGADRRARARRCRRAWRSGCRAAATSRPRTPSSRPTSPRSPVKFPAASSRSGSATIRSSRRARCSCASIPRPISWRWPRPRPRSIPRAPPSSSSRRACARPGPKPRRPRTS